MSTATIDLGAHVHDDLRWVVSILWGALPGVRVRLGDPRPGERVLEDLLVVPDARRPRLLLPNDPRASRAAVAASSATRGRSSRLRRGITGLALAGPARRLVFRDRLVVVADRAVRTVGDMLAESLGTPVLLAVSVRPPTPARKPVLQVLDPNGRIRAYAKVGWHPVSDGNVASEARFLKAVSDGDLAVGAPRLIAELDRDGHPVIVTAPMPGGIRRLGAGDPPPESSLTGAIASLFGTSREPLTGGAIVGRLRARLSAVARTAATAGGTESVTEMSAIADPVATLVDALEAAGDPKLPVGAWHGDWSPWNLGRLGGRLWAWDWEYARVDVPFGIDLAHYGFQVAFVADQRSLGEAFARARSSAAGPLATLGLGEEAVAALHAAHVAEVAIRYLESAAEGVAPPPRFTADAEAVIRAETARIT